MTCAATDLEWKGMADDNVVAGDFVKPGKRRDPAQTSSASGAPSLEPGVRNGSCEVRRVGFESRKCPPGSTAIHQTHGVCEVIWGDGFSRRIRFWVGEGIDAVEDQVTVDVRSLVGDPLRNG